MGISDMIPGISGGTIAVILGIYDRLLESISGIFGSQWYRHMSFLIPLGLGMAAAFLLLSRVIQYLLDEHFVPTQFFFLGLVVGVLPYLARGADMRRNFSPVHFVILFVSAGLLAALALVNPTVVTEPVTQLTSGNFWSLFLAGWLASTAMLLPGISGSFVLLVLGVYPTAINALATLNVPLIVTIGTGVITGFIVSSKGIRYVISRYPNITNAALIGLIAGSTFVIFPGIADGVTLVMSGITLTLGAGLSFVMSRPNPGT